MKIKFEKLKKKDNHALYLVGERKEEKKITNNNPITIRHTMWKRI
jgi:hypothetical protein